MWGFLLNNALPLLGTLATGVVGWFLAHFVAAPILRVHRLKARVLEELIFTDNVSNPQIDKEAYDAAVNDLRRLASKIFAEHHSSNRFTEMYHRQFRGFDLPKAATGLIGLSNTLSRPEKVLHRHRVEKGLRLPMTYTDEQVEESMAAAERRQGAV